MKNGDRNKKEALLIIAIFVLLGIRTLINFWGYWILSLAVIVVGYPIFYKFVGYLNRKYKDK